MSEPNDISNESENNVNTDGDNFACKLINWFVHKLSNKLAKEKTKSKPKNLPLPLALLISLSYILTLVTLVITLWHAGTFNSRNLEPNLSTELPKEEKERIDSYVKNNAYINDRIRNEVDTAFKDKILLINGVYGLILAFLIPVGGTFFIVYLREEVQEKIQKDIDTKINPILQETKESLRIVNNKREELENFTDKQKKIEKELAEFRPISRYVMQDNNKSAKNQAFLNHIASQLSEEELSRLTEGILVKTEKENTDINQIKQEIKDKLEEKLTWLKQFSGVSWQSYVNIGNQFAQEEFYEKALECYEQALKLSKKNHKVYYKVGYSQFNIAKSKGQVDLLYKALGSLEKACELCSGQSCPEIWYEHGNVTGHLAELLEKPHKNNYYRKAIASYDNAIQQKPKEATLHFAKGEAYYKLSNYVEAEKAFKEAINNDGSTSWYWRHHADSLAAQGKYQESIDSYRESIRLSEGSTGNQSDNYYWAHYSLGDALRKSVHIYRKNEIELVEATLSLNEAIEHYKEALRCNSSLTKIHYKLGRAYTNLGQVHHLKQNEQEAINNYELAISSHKKAIEFQDSALSRFHLAFAQRQLNSLSEQSIALKEESKYNFDTALKVLNMQENDSHITLYNEARWYALHFTEQSDDVDEVINYLNKAVHENKWYLSWVEGESDFDFVREQPKFQEWLQRVSKEAS